MSIIYMVFNCIYGPSELTIINILQLQVASFALWVFEHLNTMDMEVAYIWKSPNWTVVKALYVFVRYGTYLDSFMNIVGSISIGATASDFELQEVLHIRGCLVTNAKAMAEEGIWGLMLAYNTSEDPILATITDLQFIHTNMKVSAFGSDDALYATTCIQSFYTGWQINYDECCHKRRQVEFKLNKDFKNLLLDKGSSTTFIYSLKLSPDYFSLFSPYGIRYYHSCGN
ncbi:hypothetical protein BDQ17DRAFT_1336974 [Cyathus striatus]|nr:hypothetical protein BDQ17DRAFT_1336974 [Cyathus striatus]